MNNDNYLFALATDYVIDFASQTDAVGPTVPERGGTTLGSPRAYPLLCSTPHPIKINRSVPTEK